MSEFFNLPAIITEKVDLSDYSVREKIEIVEWYMKNAINNIASTLEIDDHVKDGYYFRQMIIPEGIVAIGKVHLFKHIFVILDGTLELSTDDFTKRVTADIEHPFVAVIPSNSKKIVYTHTKCVLATFHKTDGKDEDKEQIHESTVEESDLTWVSELMAQHGITEDSIMRLDRSGGVPW